jgi:hypothetical protein
MSQKRRSRHRDQRQPALRVRAWRCAPSAGEAGLTRPTRPCLADTDTTCLDETKIVAPMSGHRRPDRAI